MKPEPAAGCSDHAQACVIVPVFNNARTVGDVVCAALKYVTTVIAFDDGSTDGSGEKAQAAGATVLRHNSNTGKGTALRQLLEAAHLRGFAYAISLDADGQHLAEDLPHFLEAALKNPGALILGARDLVAAGAPASSEFGRKTSNFWIWFETGIRVPDSQSGFRGYPLPESVQLKARGRRYEFEADILLRAAWAGIPIHTVPIHVVYPADRVTHFRLVVDNIRIVALNTAACLRMPLPFLLGPSLRRLPRHPGLSLFALRRWAWLGGQGPGWRAGAAAAGIVCGLDTVEPWLRLAAGLASVLAGLGALPALAAATTYAALVHQGVHPAIAVAMVVAAFALLGRLEAMRLPPWPRATQWTGRSRGGVFGHWFFFQVTRRFGLSLAYWVLYPVTFYFFCTWRSARNASLQFLERALGPAPLPVRLARTYRHFLAFARTMVDRAFFAIRGKGGFRYEENGIDHIRAAAANGRGAILLTAHVGNWEVAAELLGEAGKKLAVVAYRGDHEKLTRYMDQAQGPRPRIIDVGSDMFSSLEMLRSLREGTVLAVQGDRPMDRHVVRLPFLGREAPFPVGPFLLAALSGAPLIATFSVQVAPATYHFFAEPPARLSFRSDQTRDAQLRTWVQQYVAQLEALVRRYPYQWFNFYEFWDAAPPTPVKKPPARRAAEREAQRPDAGHPPPKADPGRPVAPMH
ncbi:MAG: glycosyltransferase [Myxococcaceae bacterium]